MNFVNQKIFHLTVQFESNQIYILKGLHKNSECRDTFNNWCCSLAAVLAAIANSSCLLLISVFLYSKGSIAPSKPKILMVSCLIWVEVSVCKNPNRMSNKLGYFLYGSMTYPVLPIICPSAHKDVCFS
ncbi:hypothetical protein BpHYR1_045946 [Brachionus plicatilis]|uniref:Uncharacterized protein n=1 Tax=Brachionus plicatilis TaxID=10195 RepID=A0A3M7T6I3_BRAPC|nr:hypothetical protein BpHYR1_045946 [Brachionus plicatilis]